MLFKDTVNLISETHTVNDVGDPIATQVKKEVLADKQSVRQAEFYQAAVAGLRPEMMFVIRSCDYADELKLEFNSKTYNIIRSYSKDGEFTELICQGLVVM